METTERRQNQKIVIDTSVILHDALALKSFPKAEIHIPFCVIEEVDRFKRDMGENGKNARRFSRFMDTLRNRGSLTQGVPLNTGAYVFVDIPDSPKTVPVLSKNRKGSPADHLILETALNLKKRFPEDSVEVVSKDINLRLKSDLFGVKCRDYDPDRLTSMEGIYTGVRSVEAGSQTLSRFFKEGGCPVPRVKFYPNQYVILKGEGQEAPGRYDRKKNQVVSLSQPALPLWPIHPRNPGQSFAYDALFNDDILFVSLLGKAGTGKTLLALTAGLHKVMDEGRYQKLLISRPIFPMGRDIGYLPGDIDQKLNPWMQPVFDSLEFIVSFGKKRSGVIRELMDQNLLSVEPLTYIRGRSLPRQYLIVDEAQNLTPHEIKTIITRAGQGSKVILTGDCCQIDNPYMDSADSGLVYSIEKFKGEDMTAHVTLDKGERSPLAELAANLL